MAPLVEGVARFYGEVLPAMQRLALRIAELFPDNQATHSIPLMLPQHHTTVTLTQVHHCVCAWAWACACACAWACPY